MRKILCAFILFSISFIIYSQDVMAITDNGKKVILHDNWQWEYYVQEAVQPVSNLQFVKNPGATESIEARIKTYKFWYDPEKWDMQKLTDGSAEYQFVSKDGEIYARLISEKMKITTEFMRQVIESNARKNAQIFDPIEESEIIVNGIQVNKLKVHIQMKEMDLIFQYYYFSNDLGTVQLFAYSTSDLFSKDEASINDFMNGIMKN